MSSSENEIKLILEITKSSEAKIDKIFNWIGDQTKTCAIRGEQLKAVTVRIDELETKPEKWFNRIVATICLVSTVTSIYAVLK